MTMRNAGFIPPRMPQTPLSHNPGDCSAHTFHLRVTHFSRAGDRHPRNFPASYHLQHMNILRVREDGIVVAWPPRERKPMTSAHTPLGPFGQPGPLAGNRSQAAFSKSNYRARRRRRRKTTSIPNPLKSVTAAPGSGTAAVSTTSFPSVPPV
jgi:hypothetical protein